MLIRQSKNTFVRFYDDSVHIVNQLSFQDRVYDETGVDFLREINRNPQQVDDIVNRLKTLYGDSVSREELYDDFGRRILLREDLDNEDETVRLPDTGYMIKADGGVDGGSNPAVIALLGILVTAAFVIVRGFTKTIIGTRKAF